MTSPPSQFNILSNPFNRSPSFSSESEEAEEFATKGKWETREVEFLDHCQIPLLEKVNTAIVIQLSVIHAGKNEFIKGNYKRAFKYFLAARPVTNEVEEYIGFCLVKLKCWRIAAAFFESALQEQPDASLEYLAETCLTLKEEEVPFEIINAIVEREKRLQGEGDLI